MTQIGNIFSKGNYINFSLVEAFDNNRVQFTIVPDGFNGAWTPLRNPNHLLIFLNGNLLEGGHDVGDDYWVRPNNILEFRTPPAPGDTFTGIILGDSLDFPNVTIPGEAFQPDAISESKYISKIYNHGKVSSGAVTIDAELGFVHYIEVGGDITINAPINLKDNRTFIIRIILKNAHMHNVGFANQYFFPDFEGFSDEINMVEFVWDQSATGAYPTFTGSAIRRGDSGNWVFESTSAPMLTSSSHMQSTQHRFGKCIALSGDGNWLAVGSRYNSNFAPGKEHGYVYMFKREGHMWKTYQMTASQQFIGPYVAGTNKVTAGQIGFVNDLSLSYDGTRLFIGAPTDQEYNTGQPMAGAIYVYTRAASTGYYWLDVNSNNPNGSVEDKYTFIRSPYQQDSFFGYALDCDDSGSRLVVSSPDYLYPIAAYHANVYIYDVTWSGSLGDYTFTQLYNIDSQNATQVPGNDPYYCFGCRVAISGDGKTVAISNAFDPDIYNGINYRTDVGWSRRCSHAYQNKIWIYREVPGTNGTNWELFATVLNPYRRWTETAPSLDYCGHGFDIALNEDGSRLYASINPIQAQKNTREMIWVYQEFEYSPGFWIYQEIDTLKSPELTSNIIGNTNVNNLNCKGPGFAFDINSNEDVLVMGQGHDTNYYELGKLQRVHTYVKR